MDYKQKYLKYKQKYISLKQSYGGGHDDQQKKQEEQKKQEHQKKLHEYQPHQLVIDGHDESDDEPEFIAAAAAPAPVAPPVIPVPAPVPAPAPIPIAPPALVPIPGPFAGHIPVDEPLMHIEEEQGTVDIINERILNYIALQLQDPMAPPQLVRNLPGYKCVAARDLMPQNGDSVVFVSQNMLANGVRRNYLVRLDNAYYRVDLTVGQADNITVSRYFFD